MRAANSSRRAAAVRRGDRAGLRELARDASRTCAAYRTLLWFLLAYWFYIDGVNTIIKMAVDYGLSLGLDAAEPDHGAAGHAVRRLSGGAGLRLARQAHRARARGIFIAIGVYTGADGRTPTSSIRSASSTRSRSSSGWCRAACSRCRARTSRCAGQRTRTTDLPRVLRWSISTSA